jgi:UTRA domain
VVNEVRSIWNIGELRLISKRIERVRLADITPMSFDETYLPLAIGKQIVRNDLQAKRSSVFWMKNTASPPVEAQHKLEAVAAGRVDLNTVAERALHTGHAEGNCAWTAARRLACQEREKDVQQGRLHSSWLATCS